MFIHSFIYLLSKCSLRTMPHPRDTNMKDIKQIRVHTAVRSQHSQVWNFKKSRKAATQPHPRSSNPSWPGDVCCFWKGWSEASLWDSDIWEETWIKSDNEPVIWRKSNWKWKKRMCLMCVKSKRPIWLEKNMQKGETMSSERYQRQYHEDLRTIQEDFGCYLVFFKIN